MSSRSLPSSLSQVNRALLALALGSPGALLAQTFCSAPDATNCPDASTVRITVSPASAGLLRTASTPLQMGFNMGWWGFQYGYDSLYNSTTGPFWDGSTGQVRSAFINFLKEKDDFKGATYRYLAGDYFEWEKAVGPIAPRDGQRHPWGSGAFKVEFGINEFLRFVKDVNGKPLIVVNLYSANGARKSWSTDASVLRDKALGLLEYVNGPVYKVNGQYANTTNTQYDWNGDGVVGGNLRAQHPNGQEAPYDVELWELGNEMDLIPEANSDPQRTSALTTTQYQAGVPTSSGDPRDRPFINRNNARATYATYAGYTPIFALFMHTAQAKSSSSLKTLKVLAHAATGPWGEGYSCRSPAPSPVAGTTCDASYDWRQWHRDVWTNGYNQFAGLAFHSYYDGWTVPDMYQFEQRIHDDSSAGSPAVQPDVYVTEHATWPWSDPEFENKANHPKSTGLDSAISVGDYLIGQQQRSFVRMAINHELGSGPWSEFAPVGQNGYIGSTTLTPRPLAYALKLVHRSLRDTDILKSSVITPRTKGYGSNATSQQYDVRALGYQSTSGAGTLLANRATQEFPLSLTLPTWPQQGAVTVRMDGVGGPDGTRLWSRYLAANVISSKTDNIKVPASGVFSIRPLAANIATNGDFELGSGSTVNTWEARPDGGTTCSMALNTTTGSGGALTGQAFLRLQRTAGSGWCAMAQPSWYNSQLDGAGSPLYISRQQYFAVRANVRTANPAQVMLKIQFFDQNGAYVASSPAVSASSFTSVGSWIPLEIRFKPETYMTNGFRYAEIVLLSSTLADVDSVTLSRD